MHHHSEIVNFFKKDLGGEIKQIENIPISGSNRLYFRLITDSRNIIAAYGDNAEENKTFHYFTETLFKLGINVPELLAISNQHYYFLEDLGNTNLLQVIEHERNGDTISAHSVELLKKSLLELIKVQLRGGKHIDFTKCFVRSTFDKQVFQWDLNYFKYYFLKMSSVSFNEDRLEKDFLHLIERLDEIPNKFFLFRDFQSRNVMVKDDRPFFIDYQGGMQGPLQYDLASFLHQARANLPKSVIDELKLFYYNEVTKEITYGKDLFFEHFNLLHFLRVLQTLGAYGFRGLIQKKEHFVKSIPLAVENIKLLSHVVSKHIELPELFSSINKL